MKMTMAFASLLVIVAPCVLAQNKEVRDTHGQLVETWRQHGSTTNVRDRQGSLLETRTHRGKDTYVRDRNGRLLRIEMSK